MKTIQAEKLSKAMKELTRVFNKIQEERINSERLRRITEFHKISASFFVSLNKLKTELENNKHKFPKGCEIIQKPDGQYYKCYGFKKKINDIEDLKNLGNKGIQASTAGTLFRNIIIGYKEHENQIRSLNKILTNKPKKMTRGKRIKELKDRIDTLSRRFTIIKDRLGEETTTLRRDVDMLIGNRDELRGENLTLKDRLEKLEFQVNNPPKFKVGDKIGKFEILSSWIGFQEIKPIQNYKGNGVYEVVCAVQSSEYSNLYKLKSKTGKKKTKTEGQLLKIQKKKK